MRAGPGQVGPARGFQPAARVRTQGCGRAGADKRRAPVQGRPGRGSWSSRRGGQSASRRSENSQVQWYFVTQHSEWTRKSATEDFFLLAGVLAQSRAGQARPAAPVTFPEVTGGHGTSREVTGSHGAVAVGHGDECQINRRGAGAHITDGSPGRGARTRPGATRTAKGAGPARAPARPGGAPGRQERRRRDRLGRTCADPVGRAEVAGAEGGRMVREQPGRRHASHRPSRRTARWLRRLLGRHRWDLAQPGFCADARSPQQRLVSTTDDQGQSTGRRLPFLP